MRLAVFDKDTGRIVQLVETSCATEASLATEKLGAIETMDEIYPENAPYIDQNLRKVKHIGQQPSYAHVVDWVSKVWVLDLQYAKEQAWDRIKAARNGAEFGTFTWNGLVFDGDSESQRRIQGAAQLAAMAIAANVPWSIAWTLADNTTITMSAADMIAAGTSLAVSVAGAHNVARALRTQIDAATTQEELDAIVWPGGEL